MGLYVLITKDMNYYKINIYNIDVWAESSFWFYLKSGRVFKRLSPSIAMIYDVQIEIGGELIAGMDAGRRKSVTLLIVYLLLFTCFLNTAPYCCRNFMRSSILKTDKI